MAEPSLKKKAVSGMVWTSVEKFGLQAMQLVIGIVIARILAPEDYGIVGMTAIFTAVAQTLLDSGFGSALIQKKDRNETDSSTCFYFNVVVGIVLYGAFFAASPYIADFYHVPLLSPVCKVVGLTFLINSLTISQNAKLTAEMKFKQISIISLTTYLVTGVCGIIMALSGWGVWALVFQMVGSSLLRLLLIESYTRWIPRGGFSKKSFNHLFGFGSKILCSSIINTIYDNLYTLVIGRVYTPGEVGHYNRANQFAMLPSQTLLDTVMKVAYPLMSEVQDDNERLCRAYKKFLRLPLFLLYPILAGMIALAEPFIIVLISEKWLPCVPFLRILCIGAAFIPLTHINLNILYVKGRTDLVLKLELIKKSIAFAILFSCIPFGIYILIIGRAFYSFIAYVFNCYYTGKFINFGFWKQLYYNVPVMVKSAMMGIVCYYVSSLFANPLVQLLVGVVVGIVVYGIIVVATKDESMKDIIDIIKSRKK